MRRSQGRASGVVAGGSDDMTRERRRKTGGKRKNKRKAGESKHRSRSQLGSTICVVMRKGEGESL